MKLDKAMKSSRGNTTRDNALVDLAKERVQPLLMERLDVVAASKLPREELSRQVGEIVAERLGEEQTCLNAPEQAAVPDLLVNDMPDFGAETQTFGLGKGS